MYASGASSTVQHSATLKLSDIDTTFSGELLLSDSF